MTETIPNAIRSAVLAGATAMAFAGLAIAGPAGAQGTGPDPAIDCGATDIESHSLICGDSALRARATVLGLAYRQLLETADSGARVALMQGEADYMIRRDGCRTASCLTLVFDTRQEELAAAARVSGSQAPAGGRQVDARRSAEPAPPPESRSDMAASEAPAAEEAEPPVQQAGLSSAVEPPEPLGDTAEWITADDYPSEQLTGGEIGITRYQVRVGANGLPAQCFTIESSGHWQLDTRVCNRIMRRARFTPGRDAEGNPVEGLYQASYEWTAPQPAAE